MEFDYIIIGGGSAGAVLANRLSEDPDVSVALLETGVRDRSPAIHTPIGIIVTVPRPYLNYAYETVPQPGLNNRRAYQPRGKTLGGSSSINAMVYVRGHPSDYDDWAALGNTGWGWSDVLPYFIKAEHNERIHNELHGQGGPLNVTDLVSPNAARDAFILAGQQAGFPRNDDFNGISQEGIGPFQVTQKDGKRCSSAQAYLRTAEQRPNLTVLTRTRALQLTFKGKRCCGVEALHKGTRQVFTARREVIVSAGAINTPQLLMLSGIGEAGHLQQHGIQVRHHLPGVGQNLIDHPDYVSSYRSHRKDVFGLSPQGLWSLLRDSGKYVMGDPRGLLNTNGSEAGGFLKTDPALPRPDIQLHFVVALLQDHARKIVPYHGVSCHTCVLRPKSRGWIKLRSNNPLEAPLIHPDFLADQDDMDVLLKGVRMAEKIMAAPAMSDFAFKEYRPALHQSDTELKHTIRERADSIYHPVGTCRMGRDDGAVVDSELRVKGLSGLRVVDASIMPTLIGGNTNAPVIMIAEKAADLIKQAEKESRLAG